MLMNSRGRPPFVGCMLMNSRGGPRFWGLMLIGSASKDNFYGSYGMYIHLFITTVDTRNVSCNFLVIFQRVF